MVREDRIKTANLTTDTFTVATSGVAVYLDNPINGQIVQIDQSAFWQNGSLSLSVSGTGQVIWLNNASSGAGVSNHYPAHFNQTAAGSIANASLVPYCVDNVLILKTGSTASGTDQILSVDIKYI